MKEAIVNVNKREMFSRKAGMSYLQIAILIISSFAFSYLVYESSKVSGEENIKIKNPGNAKINLIGFIIKIITKPMLARVSAQSLNCCPRTKLNDTCLDFASSDCASQCSQSCLPVQCNFNAGCKPGCCYDKSQGLCISSSPKAKCEQDGGLWKDSADCNLNIVPECRLGCCVLGNDVEFVTSARCQKLAGERSLQVDFRAGITSEDSCIILSLGQSRGACVFNDNSCKMLTNPECRALTGKNIFSALCTAIALNTSCKPTQETICVEGKDEVYFVDTCGNPGNIYDYSKRDNQSYWEKSVSKFSSCGASSSNGNAESKTCGNCDRYTGSSCKSYQDAGTGKPSSGNFICADLSCKNAPSLVDGEGKIIEKKNRKNGESWCIYDSKIGEGDDLPGSRHFKYSCIDGEVKKEPCADARNEICVESVIGKDMSNAVCRANNWRECFATKYADCTDILDCQAKSLVIDKFRVDLCMPDYPGGFGAEKENQDSAKDVCSQATRTCTVKYKSKGFPPKCVCDENCECLKESFTQKMNDVCRKLGDCGGEANIVGVYTENYQTVKAPKLSPSWITTKLISLAKPVSGLVAKPGDVSLQLDAAGLNSESIGQVKGYAGISQSDLWNQLTSGNSNKNSNFVTGNVVAGITGDVAGWTKVIQDGTTSWISTDGSTRVFTDPSIATSAPTGIKGIPLAPSGGGLTGTAGNVIPSSFNPGDTINFGGENLVRGSNGYWTSTSPNSLDGIPMTMDDGGMSMALSDGAATYSPTGTFDGVEMGGGQPGAATTTGAKPPAGGALSPAAIGGFIGGIVGGILGGMLGSKLAQSLGLNPTGSFLMSTGMGLMGSALGTAAGMAIASSLTGGTMGFGAAMMNPLITGVLWLNPLTILIVGAIMVIASFFFMGKKCPPKTVTYTCMPWQAPLGGADCGKCNNAEKPCSKYRCESLGKACELLNEGTGRDLCVAKQNDGKAPVIKPWNEILNANFTYSNISEKGFKIRTKDGGCIQAFTPVIFGITIDKAAQCKIDLVPTSKFNDMQEYFGGSNIFEYNHTQGFSMPSVESLINYLNDTNQSAQYIINKMGDLRLYTRCQDMFGNYNPAEYIIDICVSAGPDKTAPYIIATNPANGILLKNSQTSHDVNIFVNEPANCKYSKQDKAYASMENSFSCETDLEMQQVYGWQCNSTFLNLTKGENNFYIRCSDQPWLEGTVNSSKRNTNTQSYQYKLTVTDSPLIITRLEPNGTIKAGSEPVIISMEVDTAGGAENGKSVCSYKWGGNWIVFLNTVSNSHSQPGLNLAGGSYSIPIKCEDIAGNIDEKTTSFNIEIDSSPPGIVRIYNSGGSLYLFTNENSECAYSNANCNFLFTNVTQMGGGFTQEHTASWETSRTYYIKCRDAWNNEPNGCSIKVRAYNDAASYW